MPVSAIAEKVRLSTGTVHGILRVIALTEPEALQQDLQGIIHKVNQLQVNVEKVNALLDSGKGLVTGPRVRDLLRDA